MKRRHLLVYDSGMGGTWLHIRADSTEDIERRWPALKVVRPGEPKSLTPEPYAEAQTWPGASMEFDID